MIKIRIFKSSSGYRRLDNMHTPVADYTYNVYFFGFIIHSVTIREVSKEAAIKMFGGKNIH